MFSIMCRGCRSRRSRDRCPMDRRVERAFTHGRVTTEPPGSPWTWYGASTFRAVPLVCEPRRRRRRRGTAISGRALVSCRARRQDAATITPPQSSSGAPPGGARPRCRTGLRRAARRRRDRQPRRSVPRKSFSVSLIVRLPFGSEEKRTRRSPKNLFGHEGIEQCEPSADNAAPDARSRRYTQLRPSRRTDVPPRRGVQVAGRLSASCARSTSRDTQMATRHNGGKARLHDVASHLVRQRDERCRCPPTWEVSALGQLLACAAPDDY